MIIFDCFQDKICSVYWPYKERFLF